MDRRILAEALLERARESKTQFVELSEGDELITIAQKIGLVLPSPDLAVIKTVYAEIDKVNRNGVTLPRKAVEDGLPTLIGKQINWEHDGAGQICGYTIDAKINEDKIEIVGVIFKSLFPEEMEIVKERFNTGELAVSFEIWNRNEVGESVAHFMEDGTITIDPIIFHGTGLLLSSEPACPKAKVFKLLARKEIDEAEKIVDRIFEENLVYASLAKEERKCKNCGTCNCDHEEVKKVEENLIEITLEEPKVEEKIEESKEEVIIEEVKEEIKEAEIKIEEVKSEEVSVEQKVEETVAEVEVKPEEVAETKLEESKAETTPEEIVAEVEVKPELTAEATEEVKAEVKIEEVIVPVSYTEEQLNEAVTKVIAEKGTEIESLKLEIEKYKSELEKISQEMAKIKIETAEVKKPVELTVGNVVDSVDSYSEQKKQVNRKAFGHD